MICGVFLAGRLIPGRQANLSTLAFVLRHATCRMQSVTGLDFFVILFNITGIVTEEVCNQKYNNTLGWKGKLCEKH